MNVKSARITLALLVLGVFAPTAALGQVVDFPGGRIAVSADGNWHDRDDIAASAMIIAILDAADVEDQLVYYGHSDHIWESSKQREAQMKTSAAGTARRFGGFSQDVFYNASRRTEAAAAALAQQINRSSTKDRLWIIACGPMEMVGRAIGQSNREPRRFVTVISHSKWNNSHAARDHGGYHFHDFDEMGVNTIKIADQNPGLNKPYEQYRWLKQANSASLNWLWKRGQVAGKPNFDCSDAGMAYWLVTGGPDGGDEHATPRKLRSLLEGGLDSDEDAKAGS